MNLIFRAVRLTPNGPSIGVDSRGRIVSEETSRIDYSIADVAEALKLVLDQPAADRPDEEERLRAYLARELAASEQRSALNEFQKRDPGAHTHAITEPRILYSFRACHTMEEMVKARAEGVDFPYLIGTSGLGDKASACFSHVMAGPGDVMGTAHASDCATNCDVAEEQAEANGGWGEKANPTDAYGNRQWSDSYMAGIAEAEEQDNKTFEDRIAPFEVGDVVQLLSGGYPMTVTNVHRGEDGEGWKVSVMWIDVVGSLQQHWGVDHEILTMVTP